MDRIHALLAADRMRERLQEAEDHRLARSARAAARGRKAFTRAPNESSIGATVGSGQPRGV
jgi:hypothetical protein